MNDEPGVLKYTNFMLFLCNTLGVSPMTLRHDTLCIKNKYILRVYIYKKPK